MPSLSQVDGQLLHYVVLACNLAAHMPYIEQSVYLSKYLQLSLSTVHAYVATLPVIAVNCVIHTLA